MILKLPRLHGHQHYINSSLKRFNVVSTGRRFGKSSFLAWKVIHIMLEGGQIGFWIPSYRFLPTLWKNITGLIPSSLITKIHHTDRIIELITGGSIKFHSVANNPDSGRGERYNWALVDEASLIHNLKEIWEATIRPTLVDYEGSAIFTGSPKGKNDFYSLYSNSDTQSDWASFKASTLDNPYLPQSERDLIAKMPKSKYNIQEYFAEFLESGGELFGRLCFVEEYVDSEAFRIGIDLAKNADYTVVSIFNHKNQMVSFDKFQSSSWDGIVLKIQKILDKYPSAQIIIDKTGVGSPICDRLEGLGYNIIPFIFSEPSRNRILENLSLLIDNKEIEFINDEDIIKEFEAFQRIIKNGKVKLLSNIHDDIVMSAALAMSEESFEFVFG